MLRVSAPEASHRVLARASAAACTTMTSVHAATASARRGHDLRQDALVVDVHLQFPGPAGGSPDVEHEGTVVAAVESDAVAGVQFHPERSAAAGAEAALIASIVHERPVTDTQLNWLNVFYAIEWVAFMLFAFYLWYRLVKDALEREIEDIEDAEAGAAEAAAGA